MEIEIINLSNDRSTNANIGLSSAINAAKSFNESITVVVGSKRCYPISLIKYFLNEQDADNLLKNKSIKLSDNSVLRLESSFTLKNTTNTSILFVVHGWSETIPKIKKVKNVKKLIVLAPNKVEAEKWSQEFKTKT